MTEAYELYREEVKQLDSLDRNAQLEKELEIRLENEERIGEGHLNLSKLITILKKLRKLQPTELNQN